MSGLLESRRIHCPWCGEAFQTPVDTSAGGGEYVEDCPVCCRPILITVRVGVDGAIESVEAEREG